MDIDSLFKKPDLPIGKGSIKRKAGNGLPSESPEDLAKRIRRDAEADEDEASNGNGANGKGKGRAAMVEDEEDETAYARADLPDPDDDDEDGRFFGGGLNDEQEQILDIFDKAGDGSGEGSLSIPALRRQLGKFERTAAKNAEQRGKYPDDPSKFIESESDLDASLKHLLPLTQNPGLYYPELVKQGSAALLVSLLSHENTDIAIDVAEVLQELTDEDVGQEEEEEGEAGPSAASGSGTGARMAMGVFIDELLNNSLLDLLIANLGRLDESEPTDSQGVFHILGVFENLLSFLPPIAETISQDTTLIPWLLKRIQKKEYDSNKQYASEVLDILLQNEDVVGRVGMADGVEVFLKVASQYRKKDPADSEEVEFMENVFNGLCALLGEPTGAGKAAFVDAEGVELMIIMMKEKLLARTRAAKVLDYAMQTEKGTEACERFVEMLGLKSFFSAFMGKGDAKRKNVHASSNREDEEHILGILASLLTNLPSDSTGRIRVLAKFVEGDYAKVERLLEIREGAVGRLSGVEGEIRQEREVAKANGEDITEEDEDEWYIRRIDAGLSVLQSVDYILAWIVMEDDGAMQHAKTMLRRKGLSIQDIVANLKEFRRNVGVGYTEPVATNGNGEGKSAHEAGEVEEDEEDDPEAANRKVILTALIDFLQGSL